MQVRTIDPHLPEEATVEHAARLIKAGAVVVFPSDSSYGLAADPFNKEAIERLFKIKGRPNERKISCVFRDIEQVGEWAQVGKNQQRILERNLPGPFTFLLSSRVGYPLEGEVVGVRIPDNTITKALAYALAQPYTATSANISGKPSAYSLDDIYMNFEGQIYQPDLILDVGKLPQYPASAVIDIRTNKPITIRDGVARIR